MMTKTHWLLYLTTTFTSALLAAAGNSCPSGFPFAFNGGSKCCASSWEKTVNPPDITCNGGLISNSSTCCNGDNFVDCPTKPCENFGTCTTKTCQDVSQRVFKFMDPEADPCQDFNQFACGKFIQEYQLDPDEAKWTFLKYFNKLIYQRGKQLLERVPKNKSGFITDDFARKVYKSCLNTSEIEINGRKNAEDLLKKLGGWPVVEGASWNSNGQWWDLILKIVSLGLDGHFLLNLFVSTDTYDNTKSAVHFDQPLFGIDRRLLIEGFNHKNVQLYYKLMVESAKIMGAKNDTAYKEMKEALLFEIELANISAGNERWHDKKKMNQKIRIRDLEGKPGYPSPLLDYINNVFSSVGVPEVQVNSSEFIIVVNPSYIKQLPEVIKRTSSRTITNYHIWKVYQTLIPTLHNDAKTPLEEFQKQTEGLKKVPPRWKECLKKVGFPSEESALTVAASSLYTREYFTPEYKQKVKEMIEYLKKSFENTLKKANWMDINSKNYAFRKLKAMKQHVVYHDDVLNSTVMNNLFKDLKITDSYFDNVLAIKWFWKAYSLRVLRDVVDQDGLIRNQLVAVGNAYYAPWKNRMIIPGGILDESVFDPFGPNFKNYAGIGFIINHEITHGFDSNGRRYDLNGNLNSWMGKNTSQKFEERAKCIIYQYGNSTSKQAGMKLNGVDKVAENIADSGAINAAYYAYGKYIQDNGEEQIIPGISLNTRQLFYLFYGQFWCAKWRTEALQKQIKTGWHAPEEFRTNIPLSNSADFAKVFNCPLGSPMNPVKKCKVW